MRSLLSQAPSLTTRRRIRAVSAGLQQDHSTVGGGHEGSRYDNHDPVPGHDVVGGHQINSRDGDLDIGHDAPGPPRRTKRRKSATRPHDQLRPYRPIRDGRPCWRGHHRGWAGPGGSQRRPGGLQWRSCAPPSPPGGPGRHGLPALDRERSGRGEDPPRQLHELQGRGGQGPRAAAIQRSRSDPPSSGAYPRPGPASGTPRHCRRMPDCQSLRTGAMEIQGTRPTDRAGGLLRRGSGRPHDPPRSKQSPARSGGPAHGPSRRDRPRGGGLVAGRKGTVPFRPVWVRGG